MILKKYSGIFIIALLALTPVVLWFNMPVERFVSLAAGLTDIGRLAGLVGASLFAVNLILSSHLHILEKFFNGLNKVYIKHALVGKIAVFLLVLHPLFLLGRYGRGSFSGALNFFSIGSFLPKTYGQVSLMILILLITLTLWLRPKYNIWKITHKFMGFAFFLASLHVYFIPSDVARYMPLRVYMLSLAGLGLAAFLYHTVFGWFLIRKYKYKISEVKVLSDIIYEINMEPINKTMKFKPGQFIFINFLDKNIGREGHPFSTTSAPNENKLSILVKNLGDHTAKLKNILPGTMAKIEGPFGVFDYKVAKNKNQIWIAGGIGIAPFLSMAKSLTKEDGYKIDLYYCVKNVGEAVYLGLLENISMSLSNNFKVITVYSDEGYRIDADFIQKTSGRLSNANDIFLCAPPPMIRALKEQFAAKGISKNLMHSEEFNF